MLPVAAVVLQDDAAANGHLEMVRWLNRNRYRKQQRLVLSIELPTTVLLSNGSYFVI